MKSYSEIEANAYKKAEQRIIRRKKQKAVIMRRTSAFTLGTAAVLGIGIFTHAMKPPKKPTPAQSGMIVGTETTSAETTESPTSPSTAAPTASSAINTTLPAASETTASARQTETTVSTTATTAHTTTTAATTTVCEQDEEETVTTTTSPRTTATPRTTTKATTRTPALTTTTEFVMTCAEVTVGTVEVETTVVTTSVENVEVYERFKYIEYNKKTYTTKGWEARPVEVGEQIDSTTFISDDSILSCNVQIYECITGEWDHPIVIKFEGYDGYWIYWRTY